MMLFVSNFVVQEVKLTEISLFEWDNNASNKKTAKDK